MYVKDPVSKVVFNTDDKELAYVKALRERAKKEKSVVKDLNKLQRELADIRELLNKIVSKEEYAVGS